MLKLKQKDTPSKPINPQTKKKLQIVVLAVLVAIGANILLWNQFVQPHNKKVFDAAVAKAADEHQQVVAKFVADMQASLSNASRELAKAKTERQVTDWIFTQQEGFDFKVLLKEQAQYVEQAQLYTSESLAPDRIQQNALSFIDIDMLNKAVKNLPVFPEAVRQTDNGQWLIQWAVPIFDAGDFVSEPSAVLLIKTSTLSLEAVLSKVDNTSLKIDVVQNIGHSGQRTFLSLGNGINQGIQSRKVAMSFWELRVLPSAAFKSENFELPLWMMALMIVVVLLCLAPALWLFTRPEEEEADDPDIQILRDKYRTKALETEEATEAEIETAVEKESPLDIASTEVKITLQTQENAVDVMVNESYAVPDAIFRAYDIRGIVGEELTVELARLIGQSIASEVLAVGNKAIIVGHDARSHSPEFAHHLQQGIISTGCDVIDVGLVPTPLLNFAVIFSDETHSGIVVTASHNPKQYNGFKIIINEKSLQSDGIQTIKQRIVSNDFTHGTTQGEIRTADYKEDYIDTVLADIAVGPEVKVVVDAGNGATSELAPALYRDLGCEVVPLFCEFDGEFPNHNPDPCDVNNLQTLITKVIEENASIGIALDGDGDRLVVVTPKGKVIWPDQLLMIFVKDVVGRNPGCDVVFDIKSTRHLSQLIAGYGGRPVMWKTGHSHIKSKMIETNALLAGEFSGHIFFKERWFGFDDGLYAAARLLEILSLTDETLDELLAELPQSISTPEIKIAIDDSEKATFMKRFIDQSQFEAGEKTLIDGLRVDFAKGWGLVRASNTSPALTLRFEGDSDETIEKLKIIFKRELTKVDSQLQLDF